MNTETQRHKEITRTLFWASVSLCLIFFSAISYSKEKDVLQQMNAREILSAKGEVIVQFKKPSSISIEKLSKIIYIDRIKNDTVRAYITKNQISNFFQTGIDFEVIERPLRVESTFGTSSIRNFDKYPTYSEYVSLMDSFARTYPQLCSKIDIGKSVKGKSILFIRINSDTLAPKPGVMFSSTMHGDETGGYILMLHLIDYLLKNYNNNLFVTKLIDSLDIWINPLANPDGTYAGGDNTVWIATRTNSNNADLNRNFPDPVESTHPDGMLYQPETKAMMTLMQKKHFVLSANYHAGDEVINYPWDSRSDNHVDSNWFKYISKEYADSVQFYGRPGYFTSVSSSGITDGYAWYLVSGGRQDYITNFLQGREVTIELDLTKTTPESNLINLWNYNYRSFLHYFEKAMYGIHGFVTDSAIEKPVKAKIEILGHDNDSSVVFSDSATAVFYRLISEGIYNIRFSANGYLLKEIKNVQVKNRQTTYLNVALKPVKNKIPENMKEQDFSIYPNPCKNLLFIKSKKIKSASIEIFDVTGRMAFKMNQANLNVPLDITSLNSGYYFLKVQIPGKNNIKTFTVVP